MNVSSIIVKTSPEYLRNVAAEINSFAGCEVHFHDETGRIVATIEGKTIGEEMNKLKSVQNIPHVFYANLMYSYSEDELIELMDQFKDLKDAIPDLLKP